MFPFVLKATNVQKKTKLILLLLKFCECMCCYCVSGWLVAVFLVKH